MNEILSFFFNSMLNSFFLSFFSANLIKLKAKMRFLAMLNDITGEKSQ